MSSYHLLLLVAEVLLVASCPQSSGCYDTPPLDPAVDWHQPNDFVSFNVNGDEYDHFQDVMHQFLVAGSTNKAYGCRVLRRQLVDQKPPRWLMVELVGRDDDRIYLAIRQDNLYVVGFTDKKGNWYVFLNKEHRAL